MDIKKIIKDAIKSGLDKMDIKDTDDIELETPPDDTMGDIAFPCFKFAKTLKKSPNEIAKNLANVLNSNDVVENVKAEGGYVNFCYKKNIFLSEVLKNVLEKGDEYGKLPPPTPPPY
ncbi:hypothetical protein ACFL2L_01630 [Patescibacteria group bacterium]